MDPIRTLELLSAELPIELLDAVLEPLNGLIDLLSNPGELCCVESGSAAGASRTLVLKPSQRLLDLSLALGAGDFDLGLIDVELGH